MADHPTESLTAGMWVRYAPPPDTIITAYTTPPGTLARVVDGQARYFEGGKVMTFAYLTAEVAGVLAACGYRVRGPRCELETWVRYFVPAEPTEEELAAWLLAELER